MLEIEALIRKRKSIRTYEDQPLGASLLEELEIATKRQNSPFGAPFQCQILSIVGEEKLGTYGIIRGAQYYIGGKTIEGPLSLEALGYGLETLVLALTKEGLGSCWLGGTFKRSSFAKAMMVGEEEILPAVIPFGVIKEKPALADRLLRKVSGGDHRKAWEELFFEGDWDHYLSKEKAGAFATILEMVRLAPSASNKQPWRILRQGSVWHFFLAETPGYGKIFPYNLQRLDMGIAACHFDVTATSLGIHGEFQVLENPPAGGENIVYSFSWIGEFEKPLL